MVLNHDRTDQVTTCIEWVYQSYVRAKPFFSSQFDRDVRHPEWTRWILDKLGSPDVHQYNVCVTGSKGKGTHAILLAAILQRMGLRVGLFTSPHLVDFLERMRINGQKIPAASFVERILQIRSIVERIDLPQAHYFGPVGLLAAAAVEWFAREKTDVNIFELGRGALHDDVNQVFHRGAILTPVFLEHAAQLGPTIQEIYEEKVGIVTPQTEWLISHRQSIEMDRVIARSISNSGRKIWWEKLDDDFLIDIHQDAELYLFVHRKKIGCTMQVLLPQHLEPYVENVAVAMGAAHQVWKALRPLEKVPQLVNLRTLRLPGRLDVISEHPLILIDGTIHRSNAQMVSAWLCKYRSLHPQMHFGAIFGLPSDKDGQGVMDTLAEMLDWVIFARAHNQHLQFGEEWIQYAQSKFQEVHIAEDIEQALQVAQNLGFQHAHMGLCILGTQSFIGDALRYFSVDTEHLWLDDKDMR